MRAHFKLLPLCPNGESPLRHALSPYWLPWVKSAYKLTLSWPANGTIDTNGHLLALATFTTVAFSIKRPTRLACSKRRSNRQRPIFRVTVEWLLRNDHYHWLRCGLVTRLTQAAWVIEHSTFRLQPYAALGILLDYERISFERFICDRFCEVSFLNGQIVRWFHTLSLTKHFNWAAVWLIGKVNLPLILVFLNSLNEATNQMIWTAFRALTRFLLVIGKGPSKLIVVAPSLNCHRHIVHIFSPYILS